MNRILPATRVALLPPYLFADIDRRKAEARARGVDLIDFGIGDPDLPTAPHVVAALCRGANDPAHHRYPAYGGMARTRQALAAFYAARFGVELDPGKEVLTLIGSKEGLAHLPLALVNPGDLCLVPDPAYPVYGTTVGFVGGEVYRYGLCADRRFLPDLEAIPEAVAARAKLLFINYPNNPTGGTADLADLKQILDFAEKYDLIVVSDLAYSEMYFEEPAPSSFLQLPGARSRTIEFYSLSKTYNMTGWRVGFAVGNPDLVGALATIKTNMDSGVFGAVQEAAIAALTGDQSGVSAMRTTYRERRDILLDGLRTIGLHVPAPRATFYVFARVPEGQSSMGFAARLLDEQGLVVTPGVGFGPRGEGFIRFALSVGKARIEEAVVRLARL